MKLQLQTQSFVFTLENKKSEFEKNVELDKVKFSWEHFIDSLADFEEGV